MEPDLRSLIEGRAAVYRATQAHAGVSLRCLDPDADDAPAPASVESDDAGAVTVRIQGPLDWFWGFDYRALIAELDDTEPKSIHLLIESPGGFLSDGLALYADLRARVREGVAVTAEARGVVASAAVLPFLAAEERTMSTGTELMVHDPWSWVFEMGTADEIESGVAKTVKGLRSGEQSLRDIMTERTGQPPKKVAAWLEDETWFSPAEALSAGFATAVTEDTADEQDEQARALARRVMTNWKIQLRQEATA